jgi:hypothetical protein
MSKRSRKRRSENVAHQGRSIVTGQQMRDPFLDRSRSLARRFADESFTRHLQTLRNLQTEDLRREHKFRNENLPAQTYRRVDGSSALVDGVQVDTNKMRQQGLSPRLRFEFRDSSRTLVCVRRKTRRAVIFALRKAGKNGKRNRKAQWTEKSRIVCRRSK